MNSAKASRVAAVKAILLQLNAGSIDWYKSETSSNACLTIIRCLGWRLFNLKGSDCLIIVNYSEQQHTLAHKNNE